MPTPSSRITAGELVLVCSRYDLGAIRSLRRLRGGSRDSPKVLVVSDRGRFLIKRRAPRATPGELARRVALSHEVQLHLGARGFPVAGLVGTRDSNNSMLELNGCVYEVFRFIEGRRYDRTVPAAHAAGRLLGIAHGMLADLHPRWTPPDTTYHAHPAVGPSISDLITKEGDAQVREDLGVLRGAYARAAAEAERGAAVSTGVGQLIHADWHPGNLLYSEATGREGGAEGAPAVVAVLDFDSVRLGRPILDLANGALQFAVARSAEGAEAEGGGAGVQGGTGIRVSLNAELLRAFVVGYSLENGGGRVQAGELSVFPWLMIEAIVVETVAPIAATGRFGKVSAGAALAMTRRAVEWMAIESERLVSLASGR